MGGVKQHIGPDDIGVDEGAGSFYGSIDVALGRQMHHEIGAELTKDGGDRRRVAYVAFDELEAGIMRNGSERGEIARISQLVVNAHEMLGFADDATNDRRADKPSTARHKNSLRLRSLNHSKAIDLRRAFVRFQVSSGSAKISQLEQLQAAQRRRAHSTGRFRGLVGSRGEASPS